jgi:iturin family lipopeptide synthetase C
VMNEAGVPQPPGVAGELCISGIGVAPGYLGRPDLTAERFVRDPFCEALGSRLEAQGEALGSRPQALGNESLEPGAYSLAPGFLEPRAYRLEPSSSRLYRTGDLARLRRDGQLELLGRLDDEVKIRGHRLTLGEIEAHLGRISGISEAAVVCAPGPDRQPRLTAYLCGENVPAASRIRAVLAETLPAALIPAYFQRVESLPRNAHGKLDRSRLSGAFSPPSSRAAEENAGPRSADEAMLLGIWREVLGVGNMGIHEDFFDAGGHSMALVQLAAAMEAAVGREIPLALLFNARTIASQAELIRGLDSVAATDSRCRLLNAPGGRPVFCLPPISGLGLVFAPLARRLGGVSLHAFDFLCESDRIERYADAICRLAGETPPLLCGYSAGGNLAFAVARALEGRGRSPAGLVLIDSEPRREPVRTKVEDIVAAARLFDRDQDLPDKVLDRIRAYARAHADGLDAGTIAAPIQLVLSRSMRTDPSDAWRARTTASVSAHAAAGTHDDILSELHISENLPLFQRLFGD